MCNEKKLAPKEAAKQFIQVHFPTCQGALLAGSVVRGQETETSDLDIVVFDKCLEHSFRESHYENGWRIEVFAHNLDSYSYFFEMDVKSAKPSMPRMVSEGMILKDSGLIDLVKKEANDLLQRGPEAWPVETINTKRYFITDALDDYIGSRDWAEEIFIANTLAELISEFYLRVNRQWMGTSKWLIRALRNYDEAFADQFVDAFDSFYKQGDKGKVILLVDQVLEPHGGRYFSGFSMGK